MLINARDKRAKVIVISSVKWCDNINFTVPTAEQYVRVALKDRVKINAGICYHVTGFMFHKS